MTIPLRQISHFFYFKISVLQGKSTLHSNSEPDRISIPFPQTRPAIQNMCESQIALSNKQLLQLSLFPSSLTLTKLYQRNFFFVFLHQKKKENKNGAPNTLNNEKITVFCDFTGLTTVVFQRKKFQGYGRMVHNALPCIKENYFHFYFLFLHFIYGGSFSNNITLAFVKFNCN